MGGLQLKHVQEKGGRLYYRRKIHGRSVYRRLPPADHPDFARAYLEACRPVERARPAQGSLAALVAAYRASSDFKTIRSDRTKTNYMRYLDMIVEDHGHRSVVGVRPVHVRQIRDKMQDKPGKANNWLNVMKTLMGFAAQNDWRGDNPAREIKMLPIGEWEPWPADVLAKALEVASPMTRLAIITGLCSGARIGDAIRMQHNWHDGLIMEFTASKNKADVAVPMHFLWREELKKVDKKATTLLYDRQGRPFKSPRAIEERLRDLLEKIGETRQFVFHGLRKNACCYLAELGLNDSQIGAIVGMTADTVRHYSKRSRSLMVAKDVAKRVTGGNIMAIARGEKSR